MSESLDTTSPKIQPVHRAEANQHQTALFDQFGPGEPLNLFGTLAQHSKLMRSWLPFGGRLLFGGNLDARTRELVILRTSARCGSNYEWGQHVALARSAGLDDETIIACGAETLGVPLDNDDRILLQGVDEVVHDHNLTDASWDALHDRFGDAGMIEFIMLVGHYAMLAGLLNAARVATEGPLPLIGSVA